MNYVSVWYIAIVSTNGFMLYHVLFKEFFEMGSHYLVIWPRMCYVDQAGLKFIEVHLLLPPECNDSTCVTPHSEKRIFKSEVN